MHDPAEPPAAGFFVAFLRPAWVVMMVAQMLLGLGLALTLVVKYYMLLVSPEVCVPDATTLGNLVRCTGTLEIAAHFVLAVAGFRLAAFMFQDRPRGLLPPLMVALSGALLLLVSALTPGGVTWALAATLVVLMAGIGALVAAQVLLASRAR